MLLLSDSFLIGKLKMHASKNTAETWEIINHDIELNSQRLQRVSETTQLKVSRISFHRLFASIQIRFQFR